MTRIMKTRKLFIVGQTGPDGALDPGGTLMGVGEAGLEGLGCFKTRRLAEQYGKKWLPDYVVVELAGKSLQQSFFNLMMQGTEWGVLVEPSKLSRFHLSQNARNHAAKGQVDNV